MAINIKGLVSVRGKPNSPFKLIHTVGRLVVLVMPPLSNLVVLRPNDRWFHLNALTPPASALFFSVACQPNSEMSPFLQS